MRGLGESLRSMPAGRSCRRRCCARGVSLIELTLVLAILAITAAVAVPRFAGPVSGQRAQAAARRITADLALAQARARATSTTVTVAFDSSGTWYEVRGMPDPTTKTGTYQVRLTNQPYLATAKADFAGGGEILFGALGAPSAGGLITVESGTATRVVVVDAGTGRATIQ